MRTILVTAPRRGARRVGPTRTVVLTRPQVQALALAHAQARARAEVIAEQAARDKRRGAWKKVAVVAGAGVLAYWILSPTPLPAVWRDRKPRTSGHASRDERPARRALVAETPLALPPPAALPDLDDPEDPDDGHPVT